MNDNLAHFLNMTYQERLELKQSNPSVYDRLAEAMRDRLNLKEPEASAPKSKARFEKFPEQPPTLPLTVENSLREIRTVSALQKLQYTKHYCVFAPWFQCEFPTVEQ